MGLSQALFIGISGLTTHQKCMDNIGNNLANVNTTGYKKGVFQFRTMLEQTFSGGMAPDGQTGRGSINPVSLGLGTQIGSINRVFSQGPLETTGNPKDMAIEGNGFFVLRQGTGYVYTRDGSFYIGADGNLMGNNGLYVQGTLAVKQTDGSITIPPDAMLQDIVIPIGQTGAASQTSMAEFKGNLDSRQEVSTGLRLFGTQAYPTVNSLQKWMPKEFNGGNPLDKPATDDTWSVLEKVTYLVDTGILSDINAEIGLTYGRAGVAIPSGMMTGIFPASQNYAIHAIDSAGNIVDVRQHLAALTGAPWNDPVQIYTDRDNRVLNTFWAMNDLVPISAMVQEINGGNVQTSQAMAIRVPHHLRYVDPLDPSYNPLTSNRVTMDNGVTITLENSKTPPEWLFKMYGGNFLASAMDNGERAGSANPITLPPPYDDPAIYPANPLDPRNDSRNKIGWVGTIFDGNAELGFKPGDAGYDWRRVQIPHQGEIWPATLETPLEHLLYKKGNTWTQPFANIMNGQDISVTFKKGERQETAVFTYNQPKHPEPVDPQVKLNIEKSYTLEHYLKFLAGGVDEPTTACYNLTPAMFGATTSAQYPDGDPIYDPTKNPNFDRYAYEQALKDVSVATSITNERLVGGAMGLLSLAPKVSSGNYGTDPYDAPAESAGAYTRHDVEQITYQRWDPETERFIDSPLLPSFSVSFVSNLGIQNALSDIRVSFNNVTHESMFSNERQYSAPQGGAAVTNMLAYDSLGNPLRTNIRLAMVHQDSDFTTWRWYADCDDSTDAVWLADESGNIITNLSVGTGLVRFDKNGNFVKGAEMSETSGISISQEHMGVNNPIVMSLLDNLSSSLKQNLDFSALTMAASSQDFLLKSQNGNPPGTLDSFIVSKDGMVQGVYSNGVVAPIARIVLALIPNENGLVSVGGNLFYTGPASGAAQIAYANVGGRGTVNQNQLETSNVDLSEEFTKLITTERGFQANAKTITTADNMLQELMNLKR